jgi:uncharacterized ion transporter superfamily protein YfcC
MSKLKVPNTYVIIFSVILLCAIVTWFVPGGLYVPNAEGVMQFKNVASKPQTWQVFSALFKGFSQQAEIIAFVLIIGGAFWVVNSTKAVDTGILKFIDSTKGLERFSFFRKLGLGNIIIVLIMLLLGLFGAVFGMSEETIAFVAIVIPLAISLGYDSITAVCMVYVAAHVGFAGAMLNPFTIGIAQNMSNLPLFSGIEYRTLCWLVLMAVTITFVLIYASRVKKNPSLSPMYQDDEHWRQSAVSAKSEEEDKKGSSVSAWVTFAVLSAIVGAFTFAYAQGCEVTLGQSKFEAPYLMWVVFAMFVGFSLLSLRSSSRMFILNLLMFSIVYLVTGVMGYGWYITEIAALFFALAVASGFAAGYSPDYMVKQFIEGAKDIFSAALVIGFAAGIIVILKDGVVIDTILNSMAKWLDGSSRAGALGTMYGIQTLINVFIPSASAKAAITMPIMAPFSDLIGISRQATVLAFQFGDGVTNMITPCSGVLLAVLSVARIPYAKWFKWVWKFILALIVICFLLLLPTLYLELSGF